MFEYFKERNDKLNIELDEKEYLINNKIQRAIFYTGAFRSFINIIALKEMQIEKELEHTNIKVVYADDSTEVLKRSISLICEYYEITWKENFLLIENNIKTKAILRNPTFKWIEATKKKSKMQMPLECKIYTRIVLLFLVIDL